jgi:hypothetical protein
MVLHLLHQWESTVWSHPIKTCKHRFVLDTSFTCDNWVTEYFGRMSEGSATKYVAVVGGGLVRIKWDN